MQNSVVSNDSPILSSNVKSLQDLKAESPNKKLDRESLKQVSFDILYKKKDSKLKSLMKILFLQIIVAFSHYLKFK